MARLYIEQGSGCSSAAVIDAAQGVRLGQVWGLWVVLAICIGLAGVLNSVQWLRRRTLKDAQDRATQAVARSARSVVDAARQVLSQTQPSTSQQQPSEVNTRAGAPRQASWRRQTVVPLVALLLVAVADGLPPEPQEGAAVRTSGGGAAAFAALASTTRSLNATELQLEADSWRLSERTAEAINEPWGAGK